MSSKPLIVLLVEGYLVRTPSGRITKLLDYLEEQGARRSTSLEIIFSMNLTGLVSLRGGDVIWNRFR